MQQQRQREETELGQESVQSATNPAQNAISWLSGVACGTVGAAAMTTVARLQNPELVVGQQSAWLLYALLGAITGFCAAAGRRKTARVAAGMSLAVLLSPWLLDLLCAFLGLRTPPAAQSALVINACIPVGAFVFLRRWRASQAAFYAAAAFFVVDLLYNLITVGTGPGLWLAVWISTLHGAMLGLALATLREIGEAFTPRRPKPLTDPSA